MDCRAEALFIRELHQRLSAGQYSVVTFGEMDFAGLLAEEALEGVAIMIVQRHSDEEIKKVPTKADVVILSLSVLAGDAVCVDEKYLAPNDTYSRGDQRLVVVAAWPLQVTREAQYAEALVEQHRR